MVKALRIAAPFPLLFRPGSVVFDKDETAVCLADILKTRTLLSWSRIEVDQVQMVESELYRIVFSPPTDPLFPTTVGEV